MLLTIMNITTMTTAIRLWILVFPQKQKMQENKEKNAHAKNDERRRHGSKRKRNQENRKQTRTHHEQHHAHIMFAVIAVAVM